MLERTRHTETVRAGTPVTHGAVMLLPIERVVLHSGRGNTRVWFSAIKEPYALIVRDAGGLWAIDTDAAAVSLEALRQRVPGLDTVLAAM
ncbi:hypothetical protein SBP18_00770 [Rhodoferax ferrireducens]|uniref:hypothetical protein n=1 Tax=Rhodoferax ferrireducens TaxID=192843 RepID=UPI00298D7E6B|nr:hypothetical protein [Rhodoferax ferrireducens]WPC67073.1 hypothetical protein SBP18_00770 [Rhodoferax ferrireducens]